MQATVTRPASWVRPPTASTMAVRLPLLLTGKPCSSPAPRLAAPSARSSRWASIVSPCREANARPVRMLSVYPTKAMPSAGASRAVRSAGADVREAGHGHAAGDRADEQHAVVGQVEDRRGRGGAEHAEQGDRRPGGHGGDDQHGRQGGQAERRRRPVDLVEPSQHLSQLVDEAVGVLGDAEQLARAVRPP